MCAVMRSGPGALRGLRCLITCFNSLRVKACGFPSVGYVLQVLGMRCKCWVCVASIGYALQVLGMGCKFWVCVASVGYALQVLFLLLDPKCCHEG